jgi:hypothetical protein
MEDNPLKAKKRAQTSPEVELSSEMQLMEDKFIIYDFTKVKRSHSLSRPAASSGNNKNLLRSGSTGHGHHGHHHHESKLSMSSATLDGVLNARNSSGRIEHLPSMTAGGGGAQAVPLPSPAAAAAKMMMLRPESPSDLVGQERFNPDEDQLNLTTTSLTTTTTASGEHIATAPFPPLSGGKSIFNGGPQHQQPLSKSPSRETQNTVVQPVEESEFAQDEPRAEESVATRSAKPPTSTGSRTLGASQQQQQQEQQPVSATTTNRVQAPYAASTTPSSPSNSSGSSTLSTPATTYNNSPAPYHPHKHGAAGTILFSSPDSGTSLSTIGASPFGSATNPLMDPATIPNTPVTLRSRALRGREPSQSNAASGGGGGGAKGGRAFELSSQAQQERHQHQHHPHAQHQPSQQRQQQQQPQQQHHLTHQKTTSQVSSGHGRPMSAYTTSTSNAGSFHEAMMEFQETRSMTLAYQPHPFRASISGGLEGLSAGLRKVSLDGLSSSNGNNSSLPPPLPPSGTNRAATNGGSGNVAVATAEATGSEEVIKTGGGPGMATISL